MKSGTLTPLHMSRGRLLGKLFLCLLALGICSCSNDGAFSPRASGKLVSSPWHGTWEHYLGDPSRSHYASLDMVSRKFSIAIKAYNSLLKPMLSCSKQRIFRSAWMEKAVAILKAGREEFWVLMLSLMAHPMTRRSPRSMITVR